MGLRSDIVYVCQSLYCQLFPTQGITELDVNGGFAGKYV